MSRNKVWILRLAAVLSFAALSNTGARATATTALPGGTALSVAITSPVNGAILPEGPVTITGNASVGTGEPVKNTTLIYVVDISGSTSQPGTPGRCGHQNVYDSTPDTTLDCELLAIRELNRAAIQAGTVKDIAVIAFAGQGVSDPFNNITSAKVLDLVPDGAPPPPGVTQFVAPDAHVFTSSPPVLRYTPQSDLEWVLQSAFNRNVPTWGNASGWPALTGEAVGFMQFTRFESFGNTNYAAALSVLRDVLADATTPNKLVVFLSDGQPTVGLSGQSFIQALNLLPTAGVKVETFAVGASAACVNTANPVLGSLDAISDHYGTTCHSLPDPADAADFVPAVVASELSSITLSVNGISQIPGLSALLPQAGPATVDFSQTYDLTAGAYHVCATAEGSDGGGDGDTEECVDFTVKARPTVVLGANAGTTNEGSTAHLSATTSTDPISWSVSGGTGHCAILSPISAETDVVCDDDGPYLFTLTANDGVNPPVSAGTVLNVLNVPPTVTAPAPPGPLAVGQSVTLSWSFTDPSNDTHSCSINWGDGATVPGAIVGHACSGSHAYSLAGSFSATATVTDDNGGTGAASVSILVNRAPTCGTVTVSPSSLWPPNNKLVAVALSGGSDPDGDTFTTAITGITQDEPRSAAGDAVITSGSAAQLRASRNGSGDGRVYRIAFSLSDPHGGTCSGVVKVGVAHDSSGAPAVDSGATYNSVP